jgi:hypothetical protein
MVLNEGESLYIDSSMGHAYLAAEGCDEAEVLGVMSSSDAELLDPCSTFTRNSSVARPRSGNPARPWLCRASRGFGRMETGLGAGPGRRP